jgi:hypothetical protein
VVAISRSNGYVSAPAQVAIAAGASSALFTAGTASVTSVQSSVVTAAYNGASASVSLTLSPPPAPVLPAAPPPSAPVIAISAPASGATASGVVQVKGTATTAGSTLTKVEFYVDNNLTLSGTAASFSFSWNSAAVANGTHNRW